MTQKRVQIECSEEHTKYLAEKRRFDRFVLYSRIVIFIAFFALWELSAYFGLIDAFIFSSPSRAFSLIWSMTLDGSIFIHIGTTMLETIIGFTLGTLFGIIIAVALWYSPAARQIFDPYLVVLNSLPKIALGPVIIVWVGSGIGSIITVTLLISIVVTIIGVLNGYLEVDEEKITLMKSFGATKWQIFSRVVFPASIPTTVSVLKINVGMSWVGVIVGEFLVSKAGLGYLIVYGGQVFKMDLVMASVLILCLFAALMYYGVYQIEKKIGASHAE